METFDLDMENLNFSANVHGESRFNASDSVANVSAEKGWLHRNVKWA